MQGLLQQVFLWILGRNLLTIQRLNKLCNRIWTLMPNTAYVFPTMKVSKSTLHCPLIVLSWLLKRLVLCYMIWPSQNKMVRASIAELHPHTAPIRTHLSSFFKEKSSLAAYLPTSFRRWLEPPWCAHLFCMLILRLEGHSISVLIVKSKQLMWGRCGMIVATRSNLKAYFFNPTLDAFFRQVHWRNGTWTSNK